MRSRAVLLSLGILVLGLGACADPGDDGSTDGTTQAEGESESETGGEVPNFDAEIQPILESNCICHFSPMPGGDMTAPYLNLNAGFAVGELVDVDSVQVPSMKRVTPGDIDNSYLAHKLRGTHVDVGAPMDTDAMPPLGPLPEQDIATIEAWIAGGAPPG